VNVPPAGGPAATPSQSGEAVSARRGEGAVKVRLRAGAAGRAHLFVRDGRGTAGSRVVTVPAKGTTTVTVTLDRALDAGPAVVAGWEAAGGGTAVSRVPVR
jgi:acyl CoA:acetate/3-ketoacid CoA transferase alpha subunit